MEAEKQCFQYMQWYSQDFKLAGFILPVLTTFLGAWFAFLWQNSRETKVQEELKYGTLLKTQVLFYGFFEVIYSIKKDYLDPYEKNANRSRIIKHIGFCHKFPELEFNGLSFILATKDPDLFGDIISAYRKCVSTIESIDDFNQQYKKICDKSVKTEKLGNGQFQITANEGDLAFLEDFTDIMYRDTKQALICINEIDSKLQKFIKGNFRKKHALKADIIAGK
jgi:hypothetical protein